MLSGGMHTATAQPCAVQVPTPEQPLIQEVRIVAMPTPHEIYIDVSTPSQTAIGKVYLDGINTRSTWNSDEDAKKIWEIFKEHNFRLWGEFYVGKIDGNDGETTAVKVMLYPSKEDIGNVEKSINYYLLTHKYPLGYISNRDLSVALDKVFSKRSFPYFCILIAVFIVYLFVALYMSLRQDNEDDTTEAPE
jgi:hypothetical protein